MAARHPADCYPCRGTGYVIGFGAAPGAPCPAECGCECEGCGRDCGCVCNPEQPELLEECHGGCGQLVRPNAIGIASCGETNCAAREAEWRRLDAQGRRV